MEELSPRSKNIKYTYLDRPKPKKNKDHSDLFTESESEMPSETKSTASKAKRVIKPASTVGEKQFEFKMPSPKRPDAKKPLSTSGHARGAPSIGSLRGLATEKAPASRAGGKPRSSLPKQQQQSESEMDDDASVAESFVSLSRVRRTEPERIAYFKNQPECADIEPHRVFCTRCQKFISLGKKSTYTVKPWEKHREKCDAKVPKAMFEGESDAGASQSFSVTRKTEAERKAELEADPRAEKVEQHRIQCRRCQSWVETNNNKMPYSLYNWTRHQAKCSAIAPSTRVAMAERKVRVINDAQAKGHSPRHVECKVCNTTIELAGAEYNLENWEAHKGECPVAEPSVSGATDATLVTPLPDSPEAPRGTKRPLEEEEEDTHTAENVRPTNKPRDENYEETTEQPPNGLVGWFMQPLREFVRGFAEGLS